MLGCACFLDSYCCSEIDAYRILGTGCGGVPVPNVTNSIQAHADFNLTFANRTDL